MLLRQGLLENEVRSSGEIGRGGSESEKEVQVPASHPALLYVETTSEELLVIGSSIYLQELRWEKLVMLFYI